jgi:hypothetical protein
LGRSQKLCSGSEGRRGFPQTLCSFKIAGFRRNQPAGSAIFFALAAPLRSQWVNSVPVSGLE